jgi:hypothetical protein
VASDDDLSGYVRRIEDYAGEEDDDEGTPASPPTQEDPAGAARLVEDIERFLRDQGPD